MSVFTHVTIGTNDLEQSRIFYDKVLGALGMGRMFDGETMSAWGKERFAVIATKPLDGKPATHANGGTIGFAAADRAAVDNFHAEGLANGATCDGAPGERAFAPNAYGAYIRDAVGNKFCAYSYTPE